MGLEIERKFLVVKEKLEPLLEGLPYSTIYQGYLCVTPRYSIRVRAVCPKTAKPESRPGEIKRSLTIKTATSRPDIRGEIELPLTGVDADLLLTRCSNCLLKNRYKIAFKDGLSWDVDLFFNGLILAELELPYSDYKVSRADLPDWVGEEVTDDPQYRNENMKGGI